MDCGCDGAGRLSLGRSINLIDTIAYTIQKILASCAHILIFCKKLKEVAAISIVWQCARRQIRPRNPFRNRGSKRNLSGVLCEISSSQADHGLFRLKPCNSSFSWESGRNLPRERFSTLGLSARRFRPSKACFDRARRARHGSARTARVSCSLWTLSTSRSAGVSWLRCHSPGRGFSRFKCLRRLSRIPRSFQGLQGIRLIDCFSGVRVSACPRPWRRLWAFALFPRRSSVENLGKLAPDCGHQFGVFRRADGRLDGAMYRRGLGVGKVQKVIERKTPSIGLRLRSSQLSHSFPFRPSREPAPAALAAP